MEEIKIKLDTMTKTCRCVINFPFVKKSLNVYDIIDIDKARDELSANQYQYAMIIHDKDVDNKGVLKTKHIHLVFECPKRHRLSFYLNRLEEYFGVKRDLISIQVSNSFSGDIQYLIHKNNEDKYQYPESAIMTNLSHQELLDHLFREIHKEITANYIFELVKTCKTKSDLVLKLGIGNYNVFHSVVDTFCKDGWLGYDLCNHEGGTMFDEK